MRFPFRTLFKDLSAAGPQGTAFSLAGTEFRLDLSNVVDGVAGELQDGAFEKPMPAVFMALVDDMPGLLLDVGANNGIYSILACRRDRRVTSVAFEPYPPVLDVLRRNIAANDLGRRIAVKEVALSDADGTVPLYVPDGSHGLLETSCSLDPDFKGTSNSIAVRQCRLDDLALAAPSLVKIDVEGCEARVLAGGRRLIAAARPVVFVEVLRSADPGPINALADELGFARYRMRETAVLAEQEVAFDLLAWNHVLVPAEKAVRFEAAVARAGVSLG